MGWKILTGHPSDFQISIPPGSAFSFLREKAGVIRLHFLPLFSLIQFQKKNMPSAPGRLPGHSRQAQRKIVPLPCAGSEKFFSRINRLTYASLQARLILNTRSCPGLSVAAGKDNMDFFCILRFPFSEIALPSPIFSMASLFGRVSMDLPNKAPARLKLARPLSRESLHRSSLQKVLPEKLCPRICNFLCRRKTPPRRTPLRHENFIFMK